MEEKIAVEIGGMRILLRSENQQFCQLVRERYSSYLSHPDAARVEFEVEIVAPGTIVHHQDVSVHLRLGRWVIQRGDLHVELNPAAARGYIRQSANIYAIDTALRIVNSLLLAEHGSLLIHAASAVRNGRSFLFVGVSGAGKTTIARLAPPDVTLLNDEISCVRRRFDGYTACGTPFTGELGQPGANVEAPLAGIYMLAKGPENIVEVLEPAEALRTLMRNVLFFSRERKLVGQVFESACALVSLVPGYGLKFVPDGRVWDLLQ